MATKKARDLKVGDEFIDPHRPGRMARVVDIIKVDDEKVLLTLNDDTQWTPWVASYDLDEELELR